MKSFFCVVQLIFLSLLVSSNVLAKTEKKRRSNTVLYQLKNNLSRETIDKLDKKLKEHKFSDERILLHGKIKQAKSSGNLKNLTEEELAAELLATGAVEFAEPDYLIQPSLLPNDPSFSNQWHHSKMRTSQAWDITTGNSSTRIVVCDTGVYKEHPDLIDNLVLPGFNSVDGSQNIDPIHHHGTLVAGTIGAVGNNDLGVTGLNWNVEILIGKISNSADGYAYHSDMAECIMWGADKGAKVANLSYLAGGGASIASAGQYIKDKGGILVVAAGNSGENVTYPDYDSFLLVAATDSNDAKASWSNYGVAVDISAPGVGILTTQMGGGYASASGTSLATPIIAGLVGLIYSVNPNFTPEQVEGFLFASAVDLGDAGEDNIYGHGRVDAAGAVMLAKQSSGNAIPVARITVDKTIGEAPLTVILSAGDSYDTDGIIQTYSWNLGDGATSSGIETHHTFTQPGTFNVTLTVSDEFGAKASDKISIKVNAPILGNIHVESISISGAKSGKRQYKALATVKIVNQDGTPISGVTVSGVFSGVVSGSASGFTDSSGIAVISSANATSTGIVQFTISDASVTSYNYESSSNLMNGASGDITPDTSSDPTPPGRGKK